MRNNKGISIVSLIITIIVIIIIASITIYYGLTKNMEKATETQVLYDAYELIDAVASRNLVHKLNPTYYPYIGKSEFTPVTVGKGDQQKTYSSDDGWYLVDERSEFSALGMENTTGKFLVNYDSGLVISVEGVMYKGVLYHSLNDLKKDVGGGTTVLSNTEYDENKKVNKPVLSKGMIPVKLQGSDWVVTSADDDGWYDYSKDQKAWANVMLLDELTLDGYDNAAVKSASLSEIVGKKVLTEGSAYVWIPRYTTSSIGETGSEIIFSNLIKDTTSANGKTYTCPDAFKVNDGTEQLELTGIWVSKYEAGFGG